MKTEVHMRQRGGAIMMVMGILGVAAILFAVITQLIDMTNRQTAISKDLVRFRTVLDSVIDYSIFGIKQRWCFSALATPEPCNWNHTASAERLIMSDNVSRSLGELKQMNPAHPANPPYRIGNIQLTIPLSSITSNHPLFRAVQPAQSVVFDNITIRMWRVTNVNVPIHGDEAIIGIKVSLESPTLFRGNASLSATSMVMVFPRQLNQFALIVPRDLRLDLSTATSGDGDTNIYRFANRSSSGAGLVFESPVFVNRNVHISPNTPTNTDGPYSPVTFAQRLVLGNGQILEGSNVMSPLSPGGTLYKTYDQISSFGGFQRGIEIDGGFDRGLDVISGQNNPVAPNDLELKKCRNYITNKTDLQKTNRSPLYFQQASSPFGAGALVAYNMVLAGNNAFNPGQLKARIVTRSVRPLAPKPANEGGWKVAPEIDNEDLAIGTLFASFGPQRKNFIQARVSLESEIRATFIDTTAPFDHPEIKIRIKPVLVGGNPQPNRLRFEVEVDPSQDLSQIPSPIYVYFKAYDYGTHNGSDRRKNNGVLNTLDPNYLREANMEFTVMPGVGINPVPYNAPLTGTDSQQFLFNGSCPGTLPAPLPPANGFIKASACSGSGPVVMAQDASDPLGTLPAATNFDYQNLRNQCEVIESHRGSAMGMADWGTADFVASTRSSWNFHPVNQNNSDETAFPAPVSPLYPEFVFDNTTNDRFVVHSIVSRCRISAQATRVTTLLACDHLLIEDRATPLQINGTIIANRTEIAPSALRSGIRWRSLRHSQAVYDLRNSSLLRQHNFTALCGTSLAMPEFSPAASIAEMSTQLNCNPLKLAQAAEPFNWTTVDPDCGIQPGASFVSCKRRPLRYSVRELSRVSE